MSIVYSSRNNRKATATTIIGNTQCQPYNTAGQGHLSLVLVVQSIRMHPVPIAHSIRSNAQLVRRTYPIVPCHMENIHSFASPKRSVINVCTAIYGKSVDQPGKVASPARGQLNRETYFSLPPLALENLVSRDGFGSPVPRQCVRGRHRFQVLRGLFILTIKPCPLHSLVQGFLERARRMNPCRGGMALETKIRSPMFAPVIDGADACDRNLLGTNVHTPGSHAEGGRWRPTPVLRDAREQLSIRSSE